MCGDADDPTLGMLTVGRVGRRLWESKWDARCVCALSAVGIFRLSLSSSSRVNGLFGIEHTD